MVGVNPPTLIGGCPPSKQLSVISLKGCSLVELSLLDPDMLIVHYVTGVIRSRDRMGVG